MNRILLIPIILGVLIGCQSQPEPDTKVEATRLAAAQSMRKIFDNAHGDYNSLSPNDKTELLKQFNGNEANAQKAWEMMKSGGAGSSTTQAGPSAR